MIIIMIIVYSFQGFPVGRRVVLSQNFISDQIPFPCGCSCVYSIAYLLTHTVKVSIASPLNSTQIRFKFTKSCFTKLLVRWSTSFYFSVCLLFYADTDCCRCAISNCFIFLLMRAVLTCIFSPVAHHWHSMVKQPSGRAAAPPMLDPAIFSSTSHSCGRSTTNYPGAASDTCTKETRTPLPLVKHIIYEEKRLQLCFVV